MSAGPWPSFAPLPELAATPAEAADPSFEEKDHHACEEQSVYSSCEGQRGEFM